MAIPWLIGAAVVATVAAIASSGDDSEYEAERQADQRRKQAKRDREESQQRERKKMRKMYLIKLTEGISGKYQISDDIAVSQVKELIKTKENTKNSIPLLKSKSYKKLSKLELDLEKELVSIKKGEKILEGMHEYFK